MSFTEVAVIAAHLIKPVDNVVFRIPVRVAKLAVLVRECGAEKMRRHTPQQKATFNISALGNANNNEVLSGISPGPVKEQKTRFPLSNF